MLLKSKFKFEQVGALESGVGQSTGKAWKKVTFVFSTIEERPENVNMVAMTAFNDRINACDGAVKGDTIEVLFDLISRESKTKPGSYFTEASLVSATNLSKIAREYYNPAAPSAAPAAAAPAAPSTPVDIADDEDDLPFD